MTSDATVSRRAIATSLHDRAGGRFAAGAGAWLVGFATVLYLALRGGGFDSTVSGQAGIVNWWAVILAVGLGLVPLSLGRSAWIALGCIAGFALWTGLATTWTGSADRTVAELARESTYTGFLILGVLVQRAVGGRGLARGVASAVAAAAALAVMSRLHPAWFPHNDLATYFPDNAQRLSYPLNYWNGLACFAAMGLVLLCGAVSNAETIRGRCIAAAGVPVIVLCLYLTASRGGLIAAAVGLAILLAFTFRRTTTALLLVPSAIGSVVLCLAAGARREFREGVQNSTAHHQGDVMLALGVGVVIVVALAQTLLDRGVTGRADAWLEARAVAVRRAGLAAALTALVAFVAVGAPSSIADRWKAFKNPDTPENNRAGNDLFARLGNPAGNGRYQYWMSAREAGDSQPLHGIGPGTFEFWWTRHPTFDGPYIHHAHSLWWETYAETGVVGLVLILGLFVATLSAGALRAVRGPPELRSQLAAVLAGIGVVTVFVSYDWGWSLPVLPCAALLLAGSLLVKDGGDSQAASPRLRAAIAVVGVIAIGAIAVPLAGTIEIRDSQRASARGDLPSALASAGNAVAVEPWAAGAHVQLALVLERAGDLGRALAEARQATAREKANWRNWVIQGRLEARSGRADDAVASIRRARSLNPASPILQPSPR